MVTSSLRKIVCDTMALTAIEFFQRQDAHNVFDLLWACDLLALSSTCQTIRHTINLYCADIKHIQGPTSSSAAQFPPVCRLMQWWRRHCLYCEEEIKTSECFFSKSEDFLPQVLKGYKYFPICGNCAKLCSYSKKITKTDAKARFGLSEKDLGSINHEERVNPVYRNAAAMKLYYEYDVQMAALRKFKLSTRQELLQFFQERQKKKTTRSEELRKNKQLTAEQRRNDLKTELENQGLLLRSDSQIAELYINNSKRAYTLEKSVQLIRRAHIVHEHVGDYYRDLLDRAYDDLKRERFYDHEEWSELWTDEKRGAEKRALKLFAKAKASELLVVQRVCNCGEPLFDTEELKKLY